MPNPVELKALVSRLSREMGFVCVGVAPVGPSPRRERFRRFLELGCHADMAYLARDPDDRVDPGRMLEGARSVICLAVSYAPAPGDDAGEHIARYARGRDYHRLLRKRCRKLADALTAAAGGMRARICVDTSPLLERDLAAQAGLGWIGRNGCLLNRRLGSYLLLAEIVTDLPLPPDSPAENHCGRCEACVQACPTGAIREDGLVDSRRCISYLTIENRRSIDEQFWEACGQRIFGCDVCQQVCPFNRQPPAGDAELRRPSELARTPPRAILEWTGEQWDRLTEGSSARRAGLDMFLRNAIVAASNSGDPSCRPVLMRLIGSDWPHVALAARRAMERL
jgi:epoxyqueuosine reductase